MLFFTFFFFNDTATTEIYTLSLHDALPIYNDDGKGALRVRSDSVRERSRKEAESRDQHCHHHGTQAKHSSFDSRGLDGVSRRAKLIDIFKENDSGLDGHAEKREKADAGRHTEVRACRE